MDKWYLRSDKDGDAHYGQATGTNGGMVVTARCGLMFRPLRELFGDGAVVVPRSTRCRPARNAGRRESANPTAPQCGPYRHAE